MFQVSRIWFTVYSLLFTVQGFKGFKGSRSSRGSKSFRFQEFKVQGSKFKGFKSSRVKG